jgi:hypothetical protein
MRAYIKKTISLPRDLALDIESIAKEEGKSLSAVIQESLRVTRRERLKKEFFLIQDYWSKKAKEKGILTDNDLKKYLKK